MLSVVGAGDEDDGAKERRRSTHQSRWANRFGSILSAEMQEFLGVESMNRKLVVKKIWEYIKKHNLQDPKDRRKIILDEKLSKIFKASCGWRAGGAMRARRAIRAVAHRSERGEAVAAAWRSPAASGSRVQGTAAGRLNMFHMSKQLSRHCFTEDVC